MNLENAQTRLRASTRVQYRSTDGLQAGERKTVLWDTNSIRRADQESILCFKRVESRPDASASEVLHVIFFKNQNKNKCVLHTLLSMRSD
eukprot:COSAG02_NODE_3315_length_6950_cov_190.190629_5_plen_90_part_00